MQSAVQLTEYYIEQVQFIHSDSSDSEENSSSLHFKIIELSQRRGWIKARDVQNSIRCFKKTSPNRIRIIFKELVANGHGITESSGNKLIYKFYKSVVSVDGR